MCITLHASELKSTKIYSGESIKDGKYVHVLAYKNKATNRVKGGNAMILPIPAVTFGQENMIDTREFKSFIDSICESTKMLTLGESRGISKRVSMFDIGSYTVLAVDDLNSDISEALNLVPENKRPKVNKEVLDSFAVNYPGWKLVVCCFDGNIDPEPLLFWYEPLYKEVLFAPTMDAHDGKAPTRNNVKVDHIVCFGSTINPTGVLTITYQDNIPEDVKSLLPVAAVGQKFNETMINGDFFYPTFNLTGNFKPDPKNKYHAEFDFKPAKVVRAWPGDKDFVMFDLNKWY